MHLVQPDAQEMQYRESQKHPKQPDLKKMLFLNRVIKMDVPLISIRHPKYVHDSSLIKIIFENIDIWYSYNFKNVLSTSQQFTSY